MVNALRFEQIPIGPFNTGEFGSVASQEGFEMLLAIDAGPWTQQCMRPAAARRGRSLRAAQERAVSPLLGAAQELLSPRRLSSAQRAERDSSPLPEEVQSCDLDFDRSQYSR
jgi:hypothetical protein